MLHTLSIIDEFAPEAKELRQLALEQGEFKTVRHDGFDYPGIWMCPFGSIFDRLRMYPGLENAQMLHQFFRLNREKESATSWIHADIGLGTHAVVWYLNPDPPADNGTAFFRHNLLGWDRLPTPEEIETERYDTAKLADLLRKDSNDESQWTRTMLVPGDFNRMIIYPTGIFHARWPRESFGSTHEEARLIYVAFLIA